MKKLFLTAAIIISFTGLAGAALKGDVKRGNILYNNKDYAQAAKAYEAALSKDSKSGIASFDLGAAKYKEAVYTSAIEKFNAAIASGHPELVQASDYNIGNVQYRIGNLKEDKYFDEAKERYETALKFYKRAMDLNPGDKDAKINYEFVEKRLSELAKKYELNKDEKKKDNKKDQNKEQDKQKKDENKNKEKNNQDKNRDKDEQQDKQEKKQSGQGSQPQDNKENQEKQGNGGENQESQAQPKEESQNKPEENKAGEAGSSDQENQKEEKSANENQSQGGEGQQNEENEKSAEQKTGEDKGEEGKKEDGEKDEAGKAEGKPGGGLEAYQSPEPQEGREMSEQEAKMMLEGYKGEEATGSAVRMRKRVIDLPEPAKDW